MRPSSKGALESALEMEPRSTHLALFQSLVNFWRFLGFRFATPQAIIRARLRRLGGLGPRKANRPPRSIRGRLVVVLGWPTTDML